MAIQFQYVWIVVVIAAIVDRKRPTKWVVLSSVLIIFGTLFASGMAGEVIDNGGLLMNPVGLLVAACCAISYSLFIFLNGKVAVEHHPVTRSFFMMAGGVVLASVLCPGFILASATWLR